MTGDYFQEVSKALKDFHAWDEQKDNPQIKPLYMLIKVDVDKDIVHNQCQAGKYAYKLLHFAMYGYCSSSG